MEFPEKYQVLEKKLYSKGVFSLVPIRFEDRIKIMLWRNEQIYHLRQDKPLTLENQENYFNNIVSKLFEQEQPNQILFSFLENGKCIGYGGLVHINWIDKNAEISFIMQTNLEQNRFDEIWSEYLNLIEKVAFSDLKLNKVFTYAFDLRPQLYSILSKTGYTEEARLKEHCLFDENYIDVLIHSKINHSLTLRSASQEDVSITFDWASNKIVRQYAIQKEEISFDNHKNWFSNKITASGCIYFIAEVNSTPIGSIRFDINNNEEALLSFLLDPQFHGKGYGKGILEKGIEEVLKLKELSKIIGVVNIENIPSLKTFKSLEFQQVSEIDTYITYEKKYK
ncbi:GNAT family N-acetyltransferase [Flavobacterium sp. Arc3]|jgi:RimJ/RimL family protein N-acetyltransferase|uniref:GNAT family N-acetyltransferase n=1 Tax=unclassified Flavobacterium TaxID=196869 RepID=UPI00352DC4B5